MKKISKTKCYKHIDGVGVVAWFSDDRRYRYRLDITLKSDLEGEKTACVVMQNLSRADEFQADRSVQCMEKVVLGSMFSEFVGVKRLIVVNQFAFIETKGFKGFDTQIGAENNRAIKAALSDADIIIIGWGSSNCTRIIFTGTTRGPWSHFGCWLCFRIFFFMRSLDAI